MLINLKSAFCARGEAACQIHTRGSVVGGALSRQLAFNSNDVSAMSYLISLKFVTWMRSIYRVAQNRPYSFPAFDFAF